jgi:hypothetical protein
MSLILLLLLLIIILTTHHLPHLDEGDVILVVGGHGLVQLVKVLRIAHAPQVLDPRLPDLQSRARII